ncbi:MAG: hypothetical protein GY747_05135, partial [Planctomycetes bacterium]|nr:hypothetical protein [Planctomycetota bacterium]
MIIKIGCRVLLGVACAFQLSCTGLIQTGTMVNITDSYQQGNCASVLDQVDEGMVFISERPDLLAEAFLYKAKCLEQMGRANEATELYRYVSEQHPTTPFAYEARAHLTQ